MQWSFAVPMFYSCFAMMSSKIKISDYFHKILHVHVQDPIFIVVRKFHVDRFTDYEATNVQTFATFYT